MPETKELVITRIFNAPREKVWAAWTEPEHIKKWWGPKHFTAPEAKVDLRVGGKYLFAMRWPESHGGETIWSTGTYQEIVPHERIVATDSFADADGNIVSAEHYGMKGFPMELSLTVSFEDAGDGKTKLTIRHSGHPAGEMFEGANEGWNESLDKLAEALK
jgi:uncharacterized protein YndB with AHSA1/START domain